jgi:hypothetical protein
MITCPGSEVVAATCLHTSSNWELANILRFSMYDKSFISSCPPPIPVLKLTIVIQLSKVKTFILAINLCLLHGISTSVPLGLPIETVTAFVLSSKRCFECIQIDTKNPHDYVPDTYIRSVPSSNTCRMTSWPHACRAVKIMAH